MIRRNVDFPAAIFPSNANRQLSSILNEDYGVLGDKLRTQRYPISAEAQLIAAVPP